jgi:phage terminase small subunit
MGRNRTPTSLLEAKGTFLSGANPGRKRKNEPKSSRPIGSPPKNLSKEEKKVWKQLAKEALPGVLLESDRTQFMLLVKLSTKLYQNEEMRASEMSLLITLGSKFAMNPSDRSKVEVEAPKDDAFDKFLARRNTRSTNPPSDQPLPDRAN